MTDAPIERMARAMCAEDGTDPDLMALPGVPWTVGCGRGHAVQGTPFPAWMFYRAMARAALATIREPTEAMVSAGLDALAAHFNDHDDGHMVRQIFRAMVDAASVNSPTHVQNLDRKPDVG